MGKAKRERELGRRRKGSVICSIVSVFLCSMDTYRCHHKHHRPDTCSAHYFSAIYRAEVNGYFLNGQLAHVYHKPELSCVILVL